MHATWNQVHKLASFHCFTLTGKRNSLFIVNFIHLVSPVWYGRKFPSLCLGRQIQRQRRSHTFEPGSKQDISQGNPLHGGMLLTAVADDLASSYCDASKISRADELFQNHTSQCQIKLDEILKCFLPVSRPQRRSRLYQSDSLQEEAQFLTREELLSNARELVQEHRDAIESRYSLMLLPKRWWIVGKHF